MADTTVGAVQVEWVAQEPLGDGDFTGSRTPHSMCPSTLGMNSSDAGLGVCHGARTTERTCVGPAVWHQL